MYGLTRQLRFLAPDQAGPRLRALALLLALAVALASFLHVAHSHDSDGPTTRQLCSFCSTFERGTAPPPAALPALRDDAPALPLPVAARPVFAAPARQGGQPRAPPHLQA